MDLLRTPSPSGYEREASAKWRSWGASFCDDVAVDTIGNSYLRLHSPEGPNVLVAAHIDELGLMVTHIDERGFLAFDTMGRWDLGVLAGQRVLLVTRDGIRRGVIGQNDIFRRTEEERTRPARIDDYWIDIGAASRVEAQRSVRIGDPAVIDAEPFALGENLIVARSLDDRLGCYVIGEAVREIARRAAPVSVTAMATVQEEVGSRGARVAARGLNVEAAIAVDLYSTSDTPAPMSTARQWGEIGFGEGPILGRGPNICHDLFDHVLSTAERLGIPYQLEAEPGATSTDANVIQLAGSGVATCLISIPNRYSHSPVEIVDRRDVDHTIRLISSSVASLPEAGFPRPYRRS